MLVNETLGDILKPKNRQEVQKVLDDIYLDHKIEVISEYYGDMYGFIEEFLNFGDNEITFKLLLNNKSEEDLRQIALELVSDNNDPEGIILDNGSNIDIKKFLWAYYDKEKTNFESILDEMLLNRADLLSSLNIPYDDQDEYGDYRL